MFIFHISFVSNVRFIEQSKKYPGEWEIGITAEYMNDTFFLTNDEKHGSGYAWLEDRLPQNNWTAEIEFNITNHPVQTTFAIWITKDYGPVGAAFGGPLQFTGVGILFLYDGSENQLKCEIREISQALSAKYTTYMFFPSYQKNITQN